ncbi:MAG: acetyl-CoA decarbonylase/synthase complex subunit alpha/beta [Vicinamibacteria bacterium]|jgi:acetyl-CoA synthase|nr:acetyl-CoA decarbonylase/synthase complex subunit alpha/beta [Vicinamibacteria bacterium]
MSKLIATSAIRGAHAVVARASERLARALQEHGRDKAIGFEGTAYALPVILALTGRRVERLGELEEALAEARSWLPPIPSDQVWLPYLGPVLDAGGATLVAHEAVEVLKPLQGTALQSGFWLGPTADGILREQGIKLVDGRMPGFAACVGALPNDETAEALARDLQERNILVFMGGNVQGESMAAQLARRGVEMSWETFLVPYGPDTSSLVHALGFAARAALTFGGLKPGGLKETREILLYNARRVFAFVLALGEVDDEKYATAAGAINFGFPVIADTDIPEILPSGICTYEHVVANVAHRDLPVRAVEVRGVKIQTVAIPIPVRHGPAFEGERVRKEDMAIEFGGKHARGFEYLRSRPMDRIEDGRIQVVGPEIMDVAEGARLPLAILVEVAGRKMQAEFESILERHIHSFLSEPMGVMHLGQRDSVWLRISKKTRDAGFKIAHLGTVLLHKLKNDFPAIVDKVQVTLFTEPADVEKLYPEAAEAYRHRDERMGALTDESVDIFYSCALCQSYAPNHICIITPERLGLCGAYNWLDGKAAYEMNPHGGNQPVKKGALLDPVLGQWAGVNEFVSRASNGTLEKFSAYSMIQDPMTSCGCFECVACVLPGTGGVMIVDREYAGTTPVGMTFSALAELTGGGQQTPGFIGIGTLYMVSRKFLSGDGGLPRLVWTTKKIKERLGERLKQRCAEIGQPELFDKIADEGVCTAIEPLIEHLAQVEHPALALGEMV